MNARARLSAFWRALKPWVLMRLTQPSTYVGLLVKIAALTGIAMSDSNIGAVAEAIAAVIGAYLVAWNQGAGKGES